MKAKRAFIDKLDYIKISLPKVFDDKFIANGVKFLPIVKKCAPRLSFGGEDKYNMEFGAWL